MCDVVVEGFVRVVELMLMAFEAVCLDIEAVCLDIEAGRDPAKGEFSRNGPLFYLCPFM